jgi:hypothetical protein
MRAAAVVLALAVPAAALAADAPRVRVRIEQKGPIYVGQSVRLDVTVLVPNFFMSSPEFPLFDLPGAVVTMPGGGAVNVNETIGGTTYAGIQRAYVIVPQQEGTLVLPPAHITFQYAAVPGQASPGSVTLPPHEIEVRLPPGAKTPQGAALPVARVTIRQQVDGLAKPLHVGDAITRTIETTADHTQSMMIPPPSFTAPAGVRVYRKDPRLTDVTDDKGQFLGGRRVDVATYRFDHEGAYTLPAISQSWFDAGANRTQVAEAPEIRVTVVPGPAAATAIAPDAPPPAAPPPEPSIDWRRWLVPGAAALLGLLVVFWLVRRWGGRLRASLAASRAARRESEDAYFSRLLAACRSNDPVRSYASLGRWARRTGRASIGGYVQAAGDDELRKQVAELERRLYSSAAGSERWSGGALANALANARRSQAARRRRPRHWLSPLNPVG